MKVTRKCLFIMFVCASLVSIASASPTQCTATFTSVLSTSNDALGGAEAGPYGTVCVDLNTNVMATVTFTAEPDFVFGDGSSAALNVNASTFTPTFVSESLGGSTLSGVFKQFNIPGGNVDGFGGFNLTMDNNNFSPGDRSDTIVFTLTNTSGTWGSAANVLVANASNFDAAAHMMALNGQPTNCANCVTGFAGEVGAVPEPRFYGLLLTGLLVFGIVASRRRLAQN